MKAFIDTNIPIDYICKREPFFIPAKSVFAACFMGRVDIVVSGLSIYRNYRLAFDIRY